METLTAHSDAKSDGATDRQVFDTSPQWRKSSLISTTSAQMVLKIDHVTQHELATSLILPSDDALPIRGGICLYDMQGVRLSGLVTSKVHSLM